MKNTRTLWFRIRHVLSRRCPWCYRPVKHGGYCSAECRQAWTDDALQ